MNECETGDCDPFMEAMHLLMLYDQIEKENENETHGSGDNSEHLVDQHLCSDW
jgi:hypothetical protein